MGNKERGGKSIEKKIKLLSAHRKKYRKEIVKKGLKEVCCEDYKKSSDKRCKRCPCFDLLEQVA